MPIERWGTGVEWEPIVGYSRVVRAGDHVHVSGCTAITEDGGIAGPGDPGAQAVQALANVGRALALAGASFADVVRTRIFLTDISSWEAVGRAHGDVFGEIRPATTMVQVGALIHPLMLVEIEADAYVGASS